MRENPRYATVLGLSFLVPGLALAGSIIPAKFVPAPAGQLHAGELVRPVAEVPLPSRLPAGVRPTLEFLPCFQGTLDGPRPALLVATADGLVVMTPDGTAVQQVVTGAHPYFAAAPPHGGDLVVLEAASEGLTVSRRDGATGKATWSASLGAIWLDAFFGEITSRTIAGITTTTTSIYSVPIEVGFSDDGARLVVTGLRGAERGGYGSYFGSRAVLDWATGTGPIRHFVYHRPVDAHRDFLVHLGDSGGGAVTKKRLASEPLTYSIVDRRTAATVAEGRLEAGDLLVGAGSDTTPPFQRERRHGAWPLDFAILTVGDAPWLVSREVKISKLLSGVGTLVGESWTRLDASGARVGRITPSPQSALDFEVRNQGPAPWPKLFARIGRQTGLTSLSIQGFVRLAADGTMTTLPAPLHPEQKKSGFVRARWFHDGARLYLIAEGALWSAAFGDTALAPLATPPAGDELVQAVDGRDGLVLVETKKTHLVLRLADGAAAGPDDSPAAAELLAVARDLDLRREDLPEAGLPATFKGYADGASSRHRGGAVEARAARRAGEVTGLRLWGQRGGTDVFLVPAVLKGAGAILVGVELPANKVAFWVPVMEVANVDESLLPDGNPYPYGVTPVDDQTVLLTVLESIDRARVYRVRRPGAAPAPEVPPAAPAQPPAADPPVTAGP